MGTTEILCVPIHPVTRTAAAKLVVEWARAKESRAVCAANVHMVMEAWDDPNFRDQLRAADLVVPDGKPLVWAVRLLGGSAEHVRGTDLTREVCRQAQDAGVPVGLYGATPSTLASLQEYLGQEYPRLQVAYAVSPPFRDLNRQEDEVVAEAMCNSGARILFVSLGCPKQERWIMEHRGRVPCVMLGVGAAFDFLAGTTPQAPRWMQNAGLEWVFRLASDPRRLWKRYGRHNPRFAALFIAQWVARSRGSGE